MCRSFTADEELPGSLANTATRWERVGIGGNANRSVHAAEEESEVRAAFNLDQWPKLMNLQASLFLCFMVELVWKSCEIVADILAHGDPNRFAVARPKHCEVVQM